MLRFFDIIISVLGLLILSPFFLIIALWIKLDSKGPLFYIQKRVGKNNVDFDLYKFRSMRLSADLLGLITVGSKDPRITFSGYYIRMYKLDELPQLINVLKGDMSLVGPRPEVRKYVDLYSQEQKKILTINPGITDWASIIYRDENKLLEQSKNPEVDYVQIILPDKIKYNLIYINNYSSIEYFKIIFCTIIKIIFPNFKLKKLKN